MMTKEIIWRLKNLNPGEVIVYYIGRLDMERERNPDSLGVKAADVAYAQYATGRLHLTQRRSFTKEGPLSDFHYIATGALPRKKTGPSFYLPVEASSV